MARAVSPFSSLQDHSLKMPTAPELDVRRRRIAFRAWHRGTREMDLIMGRFVDAQLARFSVADLDAVETLLEWPDPDLYKWVTGEETAPADADHALLGRLRDFHMNAGMQDG